MRQAKLPSDYAINFECSDTIIRQKWELIPWLDGISRIKNLKTDTCLAPVGVNNQTQYNCTDNDSSLNWILTPAGSIGNRKSNEI